MSSGILGVDVGGVIIDRVRNDGTDTAFHSDNYLQTTAIPGAFEALAQLQQERYPNRIFIVSKCGPKIQQKTLEWMRHHRFQERTGIRDGFIHFCRKRRGKAPICENLGITCFVDDQLEVLSHLTMVARRYLFQPDDNEVRRFTKHLDQVHRVSN